MLRNDFFELLNLQGVQNELTALVLLNKEHLIYQGHFPGQPVVPGVCMIQIMKEILEFKLDLKLRLASANQVKFLKLIDPKDTPELSLALNWQEINGQLAVTASFKDKDVYIFKFQGVFSFFG